MRNLLLTASCICLFAGTISTASAATTCKTVPTCADLGYTETSCPTGIAAIKCPFDTSKLFCQQVVDAASGTCETEGYYFNEDYYESSPFVVPASYPSLHLHGNTEYVILPDAGITFCSLTITGRYHSEVNGVGPLAINGNLDISPDAVASDRTDLIINVPAVINGKIRRFAGSTVKFNRGLAGNYTCYDCGHSFSTCNIDSNCSFVTK